jgi:hypothetical protein
MESAYKTMQVVEAAYESSDAGGVPVHYQEEKTSSVTKILD